MKRAAPDASALGSQPVTNHIAPDPRAMTKSDNPELAAAKRLLDIAKSRGFAFERIAPGPDGPLRGVRETLQFRDEVYLGGCGAPDSCSATRRRRSSLIVPRRATCLPAAMWGRADRAAHGVVGLDRMKPRSRRCAPCLRWCTPHIL